jgi:hypothetical protein
MNFDPEDPVFVHAALTLAALGMEVRFRDLLPARHIENPDPQDWAPARATRAPRFQFSQPAFC